MANIDHKAALKAAKKRVWYLENRERVLAAAKAKRDAAKKASSTPVTKTVTLTEVDGKYVLELNGTKLVLSVDNQVTVENAKSITASASTTSATVELKSNGQPYKTTAAQRAAVKKWQEERREEMREYQRQYYAENKEAVLENHRAYSQTPRGKEVKRAASKRYYDANREAQLARSKAYYQTNKEAINARRTKSKLPKLNAATLVPFGQYDVSEFSMIRNILK